MTILFSCLLFLLLAAGMSLAGMKLYVKPKEAMERVAGTGISQHEVTPRPPAAPPHLFPTPNLYCSSRGAA